MAASSHILNSRVLIVDDQDTNVLLLKRMLGGAGYASVTSTMDPLEVCELHRMHRYDLILLDLLMPGMDGFQVMEGLKEIEPDGYIPVLVITAQPSHKLRALEAGAKDFISKPFDLAEVVARVHNMLEVRLLHRENKKHSQALEHLGIYLDKGVTISLEDIARIDEQGIKAWDQHDIEGFVGLFSDNAAWVDVAVPAPMRGKEAFRQYMQGWFTAFPDMRARTTNRVVTEDALAAEVEFDGTHTGPLRGLPGTPPVPPTGKRIAGKGAYFAKVRNGEIVEFHSHLDMAGVLMQLGLMPNPGG